MIQQTVLPFKVEKTEETTTPHEGLSLVGEFAIGGRILKYIDKYLPAPGSEAGYIPSEHIFPIVLILHGEGRNLEDIRVVRNDEGLRKVLNIEKVHSSDAIGDWLRRMGEKEGL